MNRLLIRQLPTYRVDAVTQIHYAGTNPQNLAATNGPVPSARQWPNYPAFIDVTGDVSDVQKLKITFTAQHDSTGTVTSGPLQPKKAVSGQLEIEGEPYRLLKQWLIDDVSAPLNAVEVKIVDEGCGEYTDLVIKPSDLQWCEDDKCTYNVIIKQRDELLTCIKQTLITDNWQGWYQKEPANGKKHPRFSYCNEQRPNGTMVIGWYNLMLHIVANIIFFVPLALAINVVIAILIAIEAILNAIPGVNVSWGLSLLSFDDIIGPAQQQFIESAGCGREHPASLIRDYISNVCDKCGVRVDATTAPLFFAPTWTIETSDRGIINETNPYYNATILYAAVKRGIRRNNRVGIAGTMNNTEFWIPDNGPLLALDQLLNQIQGIFNAEWELKNGVLYFRRKDEFLSGNYVYDFSEGAADRAKIVEGICYQPNDEKFPASALGVYSPDASDTCGNEAGNSNGRGQMNGYVSFANTDDNPNFEGILDKTVQIGATKFRLDGASTDYIADAMQVVSNGAVFTPFVNGILRDFIAPKISLYADHVLLLSGETAVQPKILIWDGKSYTNARAIRNYAAYPNVANEGVPDKNPAYNGVNGNPSEEWQVRHEPQTKVIGGALTLGPSDPGRYLVTDYFGIVIYNPPAMLVNYPMYFEPWFRSNLWDYLHYIDDPRRNPKMQRNFSVKIELCCEDLEKCGVLGDGSGVVLGQKVKLPTGYYLDGRIKEITVSYDPADDRGRHIEIKGEQ